MKSYYLIGAEVDQAAVSVTPPKRNLGPGVGTAVGYGIGISAFIGMMVLILPNLRNR